MNYCYFQYVHISQSLSPCYLSCLMSGIGSISARPLFPLLPSNLLTPPRQDVVRMKPSILTYRPSHLTWIHSGMLLYVKICNRFSYATFLFTCILTEPRPLTYASWPLFQLLTPPLGCVHHLLNLSRVSITFPYCFLLPHCGCKPPKVSV
jgi:hypothetical protein